MCGILGQISRNKPIDVSSFGQMLATLKQRGPDGTGLQILGNSHVALGHTRLSIIDLSDSGKQPMPNEDGTVWLTFNGEIYNFRELRSQLENKGHVFRSNTDSESIIHAYEEWGPSCVKQLRGIFAFGIYDCRDRSLFLARDHVGVKPLYYHDGSENFIFASQPRAIIKAEGFKKLIDPDAFSLFLAYGNIPAEYCIYSGIKKLLPGHWLLLRDGQSTIQQYWSLRYRPEIKEFSEAKKAVRCKIEECVLTQSVSDVPVGALLSGGVDSTIITSLLAAQTEDKISTFTVGFNEEESDERRFAQLAAEAFRTQHYESLLTYPFACTLLPKIIEAYDEPFHLNGLFPYYTLSQLIQSEDVKVVLGGDGADELFAGYMWYERFLKERSNPEDTGWLSRIMPRLGKNIPRKMLNAIETFFQYNGHFTPQAQREIIGLSMQNVNMAAIYSPLEKHWLDDYTPVLAAQLLDFNCFLSDHCLAKVDRTSMACGVEVRVPFLDVELVDLIFSIDHKIIFHANERKSLLKTALSDVFPVGMDRKRKKGFSSPVQLWLENGLEHAGKTLLLDGGLCAHGYLRSTAIRSLYSKLKPNDQLLLISAELWFRRWIEGDTVSVENLSNRLLASQPDNMSSVS